MAQSAILIKLQYDSYFLKILHIITRKQPKGTVIREFEYIKTVHHFNK